MAWGILVQVAPDLDFITGAWMDPTSSLLAHRGLSHSFFFAIIASSMLALVARNIRSGTSIDLRGWLSFFFIGWTIHILLDSFNNYGTGLFEPFSHRRFSFNALYVVDPFFSIWLLIALLILLFLNRHSRYRSWAWKTSLALSFLYLCYCTVNKFRIDTRTRQALALQHISYDQYLTTPSPLNNWLWYVVAGNKNGFYAGYTSVFDRSKTIQLHFFPRNDSLLRPLGDHAPLQRLLRFSQGFYTIERLQDTLVFNDLRFGQVIGWKDPRQGFAFHYYLQHPDNNRLVVQRGRFAGWDEEVLRSLWTRIKGN